MHAREPKQPVCELCAILNPLVPIFHDDSRSLVAPASRRHFFYDAGMQDCRRDASATKHPPPTHVWTRTVPWVEVPRLLE